MHCRWAQHLAGLDFVPAIGFPGTAADQAASVEMQQALRQAWHEQRIPAFVDSFTTARQADIALRCAPSHQLPSRDQVAFLERLVMAGAHGYLGPITCAALL